MALKRGFDLQRMFYVKLDPDFVSDIDTEGSN